MQTKPSLIDDIAQLLRTSGLTDKEIEQCMRMLVEQIVNDTEYRYNYYHRSAIEKKFAKMSEVGFANQIGKNTVNEILKQKRTFAKNYGKAFWTAVISGVVGNGAFLAICEIVKKLSQSGQILHAPMPMSHHIYTILDMPFDDNYMHRIPNTSIDAKLRKDQSVVNVFRDDGKYVARYVSLVRDIHYERHDAVAVKRDFEIRDTSFQQIINRIERIVIDENLSKYTIVYMGRADNFATPWWQPDWENKA